jgi:hypothetical protein
VAEQHPETGPVPRLAVDRAEAAAALGMSLDSFERYVQPHVRIIRLGRMRLVALSELEDWARSAGERAAQPPAGQRVRSLRTKSAGRRANAPGPAQEDLSPMHTESSRRTADDGC